MFGLPLGIRPTYLSCSPTVVSYARLPRTRRVYDPLRHTAASGRPLAYHGGMTETVPQAFHVMAKPTGSRCNLRCDYCFFLEKSALYPGSD